MMSTKQYECEACSVTSPATSWGPGWITCPNCGFVVRTVYEKQHGLRSPPIIPLGYKQCSLDKADRDGNLVLVIWYDGQKWSDVFFSKDEEDLVDPYTVPVRCILPPQIALHWKPAPGKTHEEQRKNSFPMGVWYDTQVSAAYESSVQYIKNRVIAASMVYLEKSPDTIPLVPKTRP